MSESCFLCGKPVKGQCTLLRPHCNRCKFILDGMKTPYGMNMSQQRAIRFFGKQWDKKHGGDL